MTVSIAPQARQQYLNSNGDPAVGSKLFTWAAGSTTKQPTFTTSTGDVANSNPIILDSEGKTPYEVWLTDGIAYKFVLAPSTDTDPPTSGVLLGDNLLGSGAVVSTTSQWLASNATPTYIGSNSFSLVGDKTTDFHVGRRVKLTIAAGTVYGFISSSVYTSLTTITVQLDSGAIDSGLSAVELGILTVTNNSLPNVSRLFSAINDIINGQFRIAQAGTSFAAPLSNAYDLDGWLNNNISAAIFTIAQVAGSSTGKLCRTMTVTTADAAVGSTDLVTQQNRIEGYDCVKYLNSDFTIGFRVKSSVTGIHCVAIYNGTSTYVAEYTINTANTWEYKTITIIGGTPAIASSTSNVGLYIDFTNMAGSTNQTTKNAWQAGVFKGTSSQVNDVATINNVFGLEDVTLNLGTTVTINDRSYADDLKICERQYEIGTSAQFIIVSAVATSGYPIQRYRTLKRASPTIALTPASGTGVTVSGDVDGFRQIANHSADVLCSWTAAARL